MSITVNVEHQRHTPNSIGVMSSKVVLGQWLTFLKRDYIGWDYCHITILHRKELYPHRILFSIKQDEGKVNISVMGQDRDGQLYIPEQRITKYHWVIGYISRLIPTMIENKLWSHEWEYTITAHFKDKTKRAKMTAQVVFDD